MPRGRRRKIEVPTDTQPQFELGDTADDIKRRRREIEREERLERERREQDEMDRERIKREIEDGREPRKNRKATMNRHGYRKDCRENDLY